ncbi:unnamed protein product, partial [Linum tenue]
MPIFSLCYSHGKVSISLLQRTPAYLNSLLDVNGGSESKHFRKEIRPYNGMFSMSSVGAKLDRRVTKSSGPYYHHMAFKSVVGIKPEDKPDVVVRVFRMKVAALKEQIHKYQFFGKSVA